MSQLIDDLLRLSRISRVELKFEKVNLSELAQSLAQELKRNQPERKAEFIIEPEIICQGDQSLLRILLQNLLDNAWKYTGKGEEARIEFGITQQDAGIVLFMKDNGVGFDMFYADKLFQPFQRLHNKAEFPGTGIGLAIVQRIINRHKGKIWAEGKVGTGATFYFTLQP
jgi:light-regulated signal transduction histidine kinase (bacteriophytochrome)